MHHLQTAFYKLLDLTSTYFLHVGCVLMKLV